ncbi:MAG: CinA family nicotinamide mononucleotide deamidase-related protein [Deltaproteobacteria bacterium]|nr:MAG: CinA family nicotinamide mononucleotide deamidase-related protein [Deltaproteobacteria bacterium]
MNCEIVTIGSELLLGHIIDTNASYLARRLNLIGLNIAFHTTVGDNYTQIKDVLCRAVKRADLVITTGGIGPTEDDLTREVIADLVDTPLTFKGELMDQIQSTFDRLGYRMPENNKKQALIPDGAVPIPNEIGTAPGFITEKGSGFIIALPGVPIELEYMLNKQVLPYLKRHFNLNQELITSRILKVTGIGESKVDAQIKDLINSNTNPSVGILASPGDISIRITAYAKSPREAGDLIRPIEQEIRSRLGTNIYGVDDDTLEAVVTDLLNKRGDTLSLIETFSGGELTVRLRRSPLSPVNQSIGLGKREQILSFLDNEAHAITSGTAEALAKKIRNQGNSSIGLALLGTLDRTEKGYEVNAHVIVSGENIKRTYNWKMGGNIPTLQSRGATIALNTLRLALIS